MVGEVWHVFVWILCMMGAFTLLYELSIIVISLCQRRRVDSAQADKWNREKQRRAERLEEEARE